MKLHPMVVKTTLKAFLLHALFATIATSSAHSQMQVYGLWHCYTDACSWASVPDMTLFDTNNHWIIDRGDGHPSVNVVVLSFVNPVKLMNLTTDSGDVNGIPIGINTAVVNYFQSKGVRVMMSIGESATPKTGPKRWALIRLSSESMLPMPPSSSTSAWKSIMKKAAIRT